MRADVIVGGFFGDEGKGKYVGHVCHRYDAVLRVNASTNAGHCVNDGDHTWVTRQLPSVFFPRLVKRDRTSEESSSGRPGSGVRPEVRCRSTLLVLAPGALLNLGALREELETRPDLEQLRGQVKVASSISLVIEPYQTKGHGAMSRLIGSTHQGTGPAAVARAARHSLHLYDVAAAARRDGARSEVLDQIRRTCAETLPAEFSDASPEDEAYFERLLDDLIAAFTRIHELVGEFCVDYSTFLSQLRDSAQRVLIEGCNGMLLDNLHGAHPHVTSTSTNVGALIGGANLSAHSVGEVIVVISAYSTCLGKRPYPTEMTPEESAHFYSHCNEIDVAEHLQRRVGWADIPALRKALVGSHGAKLHMNKLDVLSGLDKIKVCTRYEIGGESYSILPDDPRLYRAAVPCYVQLDGWDEPLCQQRSFAELPESARQYVRFFEEQLRFPVASVGVGPSNDAIIAVEPRLGEGKEPLRR